MMIAEMIVLTSAGIAILIGLGYYAWFNEVNHYSQKQLINFNSALEFEEHVFLAEQHGNIQSQMVWMHESDESVPTQATQEPPGYNPMGYSEVHYFGRPVDGHSSVSYSTSNQLAEPQASQPRYELVSSNISQPAYEFVSSSSREEDAKLSRNESQSFNARQLLVRGIVSPREAAELSSILESLRSLPSGVNEGEECGSSAVRKLLMNDQADYAIGVGPEYCSGEA